MVKYLWSEYANELAPIWGMSIATFNFFCLNPFDFHFFAITFCSQGLFLKVFHGSKRQKSCTMGIKLKWKLNEIFSEILTFIESFVFTILIMNHFMTKSSMIFIKWWRKHRFQNGKYFIRNKWAMLDFWLDLKKLLTILILKTEY